MDALKEAIEIAGGQVALAAKIGITQQAVSYLLNKADKVPAEHVLAIERATGVHRSRLRPDLFPVDEGKAA